MPSKSYANFRDKLIPDVKKLIDLHSELSSGLRGRRYLGHITRSAVLILCASWESYVEDVIIETNRFMIDTLPNPQSFPDDVKKELAKHVKDAKHELRVLDLALDGWKNLLSGLIAQHCASLNTPKPTILKELFRQTLGISDVCSYWPGKDQFLKDFVSARGEMAHKGAAATYPTIEVTKNYYEEVVSIVKMVDNAIARHLKSSCSLGRVPWESVR